MHILSKRLDIDVDLDVVKKLFFADADVRCCQKLCYKCRFEGYQNVILGVDVDFTCCQTYMYMCKFRCCQNVAMIVYFRCF